MQQRQIGTQMSSHIDGRRLGISLFLTLVLPVGCALFLDFWLNTWPLLVMAVGLICIPLATIVVMRAALTELDRVIEEVAPLEHEIDEITIDKTVVETDDGVVMAPNTKS